MVKFLGFNKINTSSLQKAIIYMLIGVFLLDIMGIIIKSMDNKYSVMQYAVARNFFGLFPLIVYLIISYDFRIKKNTFNIRHKLISVTRGLSIVFAQGCFYLSIMNLEYATAATLVFSTPIFLTALSVPILGNVVGYWRWSAVLLGFLGIVIIIRPGSEIFSIYALLPLGAAFGYALSSVLVKLFPKEVHTTNIQLYTQLTTLIAAIIICGFTLSFSYISSFYDLFLLAIIGFTGGTGVIFLIWGYRLVEPSLIAPFEYFGLPIAFALGWVFFSEWPFDKLFPGILGIVGGGLIIVWREGIKSREKFSDFKK